jgi:CTP synthase (UTP-ammonia lyase)
MPVHLTPGSQAARIYGATEAREEFHCSFGLDPEYQPLFERGALRITGLGDAGEARIFEHAHPEVSKGHPALRPVREASKGHTYQPAHPEVSKGRFFIGTLFMPQLAVTQHDGHPLVDAFLRASASP